MRLWQYGRRGAVMGIVCVAGCGTDPLLPSEDAGIDAGAIDASVDRARVDGLPDGLPDGGIDAPLDAPAIDSGPPFDAGPADAAPDLLPVLVADFSFNLDAFSTPPGSCTDKKKNYKETDVDCGGGACPKCPDAKVCQKVEDCLSGVCTNGKCVGGKIRQLSFAPQIGRAHV